MHSVVGSVIAASPASEDVLPWAATNVPTRERPTRRECADNMVGEWWGSNDDGAGLYKVPKNRSDYLAED